LPSIRSEIGPDDIRQAKAAAESREYTNARPFIIADTVERGLSLRVQFGSVSWVLKWNNFTKSLGSVAEIRTATSAREVATRVRALMRDGSDVDGYLTSRRAGNGHEEATTKIASANARASGRWTWRDLAKRYCDDYLSNPRTTTHRYIEPSLASAAESRRYLNMKECEPLFDKLLSELRPGDLERVRDTCAKAGRKTASRQFVAYASAALTYARDYHSEDSGLEGVPRWWLDVRKLQETLVRPRGRHPSLINLARMLYVAEKNRTVPNRKNTKETSDTVLAGLWWIAFTAQRISAGFSLQKIHVLPWPDGPAGWKVVFFQPNVMKGKRAHALPIPPRVALLFERAASPDTSEFVFPSTRGIEKKDRPLSRWSISNTLDRLRGRSSNPKAGAEFTGPNLLEGIPYFSPHDIRRAFATVCADLSVRGDAISAVLDHAESAPTSQAPIQMAAITRTAYDYSQRLDLKRQAMEAWTNALFDACDAEWYRNRPYRGLRRVLRHEPWYTKMERDKAAAPSKMNLAKLRTIPDEEDEFAFDGFTE
jgi:integrase